MNFYDLFHEAARNGASTDFLGNDDLESLDALADAGDWQGLLARLERAYDTRFDHAKCYAHGRADQQQDTCSYWVAQTRDARDEQAKLEAERARLRLQISQLSQAIVPVGLVHVSALRAGDRFRFADESVERAAASDPRPYGDDFLLDIVGFRHPILCAADPCTSTPCMVEIFARVMRAPEVKS